MAEGTAEKDVARNIAICEHKRLVQLDDLHKMLKEESSNLAESLAALGQEGEDNEGEEEGPEILEDEKVDKHQKKVKDVKLAHEEAKRRSAKWTFDLAVVVADGLALKFTPVREAINFDKPDIVKDAKTAAGKGEPSPSLPFRFPRRRR